MTDAMSAAFMAMDQGSRPPQPERRISSKQDMPSTTDKVTPRGSLDSTHIATSFPGRSQPSLESPSRTGSYTLRSSPRSQRAASRSFQACQTLKLRNEEFGLVFTDVLDRPQYMHSKTRKEATLSRFKDGIALPVARTTYRHALRKNADIQMLAPDTPTTNVENPRPVAVPAVPLIVLTSDDEDAEEGNATHTKSIRNNFSGSSVVRDQHIELKHAPLSSVTKFTVPETPSATTENPMTLKWRTRAAMPSSPSPNTAQIKSSLGLQPRAPSPCDSPKLGPRPNGSPSSQRSSSSSTSMNSRDPKLILALTHRTAHNVIARLVRRDDAGLELQFGPEVRVDGQAGWNLDGHLVGGVVDESVVLATCLVVLRGMREGWGVV